MPIDDDLKHITHLLDDLDAIPRHGFQVYRNYPTELLVEHDARAAATNTYCHMIAEAERRFAGRPRVFPKNIRGLKVWIIGMDAVIRFKRMDEDGRSRNYPTRQARDYDRGRDIPEIPPPAVRLTVGYWLDPTQTVYQRTQIAKPLGRSTEWCAALVADDKGRTHYEDVTRQGRLG